MSDKEDVAVSKEEYSKVDEEKGNEIQEGECSSDAKGGGESYSPNGVFSDLKEYEKKALTDMRSKLEEAILMNKLFKMDQKKDESRAENSTLESEEGTNATSDKGKAKAVETDQVEFVVDKDISLWGVPLLPSKGDKSTDVLLIKFLKARDFRASDAFVMLKNTLEWRKENNIDSIMEQDFGSDYDCVGYYKGVDRQGYPVCYNVYGVFADEEMYNRMFGTEELRNKFLRWRLQLLEKGIQKLDFSPGGVSTLLQINDLKDAPGPSRSEFRVATKQAVAILQDNYPEFVAKNIFVNVPFWYYAFSALLSPFLTTRTKSKFVYSRPSKVIDTLVKYIAAEEIPVEYGGLRRDDDPDFSTHDVASDLIIKPGVTETIEIPAPQVGNTLIWDVMIGGWDVNYKEEFVPRDEASYTIIVRKERKINWKQETIRNTFKNKEPGKIVITIDNGLLKKKRVLYRYKIKN